MAITQVLIISLHNAYLLQDIKCIIMGFSAFCAATVVRKMRATGKVGKDTAQTGDQRDIPDSVSSEGKKGERGNVGSDCVCFPKCTGFAQPGFW